MPSGCVLSAYSRRSTPFPYTTLFRSRGLHLTGRLLGREAQARGMVDGGQPVRPGDTAGDPAAAKQGGDAAGRSADHRQPQQQSGPRTANVVAVEVYRPYLNTYSCFPRVRTLGAVQLDI